MIKNYILVAWRNLWKSKGFSAINILGLSAGLACCILIFLFIQHELSYDKFHNQSENIYRITSSAKTGEKKDLAITPAPWAPLIKKDFPEIKSYVRLLKDEKILIGQPGEEHFYETKLLYADSTIFEVFSIILEKGDKSTLNQPNSILLTNETSRKYFGDSDPMGKTLEINSFGRNITAQVTGIVKSLPANSHFQFNSLVSLQTLGDLSGLWSFHMFQSYVVLNNQTEPKALESKMAGFVKKYISGNPAADGERTINLQPLTSIHLHSKMTGEIGVNSDITYVYVFAGIALFILLIACFNFINLSTARSLARAKEVGLRKVIGADRRQLLTQFLSETTLFALIALLFAILICYLVLPQFNYISGRHLVIDFPGNPSLIIVLVVLVTGIGLLAGLYPAAVLSAFKPVEVLKGKFSKSAKGISFRKFLVTLQFAISIGLIASTIIVDKQLGFLQNQKVGFDKENVLILSMPRNTDSQRLETFKLSLLNSGEINSISSASTIPGTNIPVNQVNDGSTDLTKALSMQMLFTDEHFIKTMNMKVVAGRDFDRNMPTDKSEGFILNQEAIKELGWADAGAAIGKTFQWVQPNAVLKRGKVVGVVQNFNITPLRSKVQPLVMHYFAQRFQYLYMRFDQKNAESVIPIVEKKFKDFFSKQSLEYSFLDETLNSLYTGEKKISTIFNYFSFLAILIACLGVLGLSVYSIQQRIKEIGIRKVLGASVAGISTELLKEFIKPIFLAALIATPFSWYFMSKWLEDFAYRIDISLMTFILTTVMVLSLAILTMSFQTVKAALANPVKNLRNE